MKLPHPSMPDEILRRFTQDELIASLRRTFGIREWSPLMEHEKRLNRIHLLAIDLLIIQNTTANLSLDDENIHSKLENLRMLAFDMAHQISMIDLEDRAKERSAKSPITSLPQKKSGLDIAALFC